MVKVYPKICPSTNLNLNLHFHSIAMVVKYQKKIMRILNCTRMISKKNTTYFNVFGESVDTEPDNTEVTQIVAFEDYKLKVR